MNSKLFNQIFKESIDKYHVLDNVSQDFIEKYENGTIENILHKNSPDCVRG